MNGIVVGLLPGRSVDGRRHLCCVHHHYNGQPRHLFTPRRRRPPVDPVDWAMVKTHFLSFAAALIPFPVLTFTADLMERICRVL